MDSGVAAVLGAAVGAVGTGGAAVIAAILARSQARIQMQADYVRMLREPRKASYVAYVEAHDEVTKLLHQVFVLLMRDPEISDPDIRAQRREEAENVYNEADNGSRGIDRLRAALVVEGPASVAGSASVADLALEEYKNAVMAWLHATLEDTPDRDLNLAAAEARRESYLAYTKLLADASEAIGEGSLARLSR
ncbi:hypothetical protein ACFCYB_35995 [Streptomyces sp. NPDC056309]|uniref:hypothetical protein n=1 Tax=unclassified Streptomyces TaxID=2593676 RepID=UPI0035D72C2D